MLCRGVAKLLGWDAGKGGLESGANTVAAVFVVGVVVAFLGGALYLMFS